MGTLSLALSGVGSTWVLPQTLIQIQFAQGTLLGDPSLKKVLLIGPRTSSGNATVDTGVYLLSTEAIVIEKFGEGSPVHRMWRRFSDICKTANVYGVAPTESSGTAASGTVTFVGSASGAGTVSYTLCGETISISVANGDAIATLATNLAAAINDQSHWPVTASANQGVVTVTARIKGTNGNWIRHRVSITSGITTTATASSATLTSGATDESYTTTLASILATRNDYIVPGINPTAGSDTRYAALSTQIQTQALPTSGLRQQSILCTADSLVNATTLVTAYNKARNQIMWQKNSEWEPMEIAAHFAAVRYLAETASAWVNYDGYGLLNDDIWSVPKPYSDSDHPSKTDQNSAIAVGLTPIAVDDSKTKTYVVMSCTAAGADPRIRDTAKVCVCDQFAADLAVRYGSVWSRAGIADDLADGKDYNVAKIVTPNRLKNLTIKPLLRDYGKKSPTPWLVNIEGTGGSIDGTATGIDSVVVTRINAQIPLYVCPLCHQAAFLINEVSSG